MVCSHWPKARFLIAMTRSGQSGGSLRLGVFLIHPVAIAAAFRLSGGGELSTGNRTSALPSTVVALSLPKRPCGTVCVLVRQAHIKF